MKNTVKPFIIILLTLLVSNAQGQTRDTKSEDEKSIRAALQNWVANYNSGNYEKTFEVWSRELVGWYPGSPEITYEVSTKIPAKGTPTSTFKLTVNEVLIDGKLAVVRDTWEQTINRNGAAPKIIILKSYEVWKKHDDDKWRIIRWISYPDNL